MKVHHDKHHQAYVDKANAALEGTDFDGKPIEEILKDLDALPSDKQGPVRNNGGGHYNHSLFWESMSPDGGGAPEGALGEAIDSAFGSFDDFKTKVKETGVGQFGSGWAWLVHDGSGLAVVGSANQDSPLSQRPDAAARRRRVGARVLPEVPEEAPRLHRGVVERRQLGARSPSATTPSPSGGGCDAGSQLQLRSGVRSGVMTTLRLCAARRRPLPDLRRARVRVARPGVDLRGRAPAARARVGHRQRLAERHPAPGRRQRALARALEPARAAWRQAAEGLQGRRPQGLSGRAVGPVRRPRARHERPRPRADPLPLDADARVGVALQEGQEGDLQAGSEGLRRLRDRARPALLRDLRRREPGRRRAPAREPLVAARTSPTSRAG